MGHDPLSPSEALRTRLGAVVGGLGALLAVYSVLVLAQFRFGVGVGIGGPVVSYLFYRFFAVLNSIADAAQRFVAVRERESDAVERGPGGGEDARPSDREE